MATEGGPIGRANVELGADTSKLDAGLSAAKEKTVASVIATEKAAAAAVPADDSDRYQAKLQDMAALQSLERKAQIDAADAADRADRIARDRAKSTQNAAAVATAASMAQAAAQTAVADTAAKAETKAVGFTQSLKGMTNPARMAVGAINGIIGSFYSVIGLVGGVVAAFAAIGAALNAKAIAAAAANREIQKVGNSLVALQNTPLPGTFDPDAEATALKDAFQDRMTAENTLYQMKIDAADKAGKKITGSNLEQERKDRMVALQIEMADRLAFLRKYQEAMRNKVKADEYIIQEEKKKIEEQARKDAIAMLVKDQEETMDYYAKQSREMMRQQREQFQELRNDINGLFNTSGLEVGINRVGALIQTLIDKVGDNR